MLEAVVASVWSRLPGPWWWAAASIVLIAGFLFLVVGLIVAIRVYNSMTIGVFDSQRRMDGKIVLVTGANSGIGKETARELARRGAKVIMACRNMDTGKKAQDEIIKDTGNKSVILHNLDLSSMASVRKLAKEVCSSEQVLDVLIHNAGVAQTFRRSVTSEGLEATMATNHYGPFLLTHLLINLLKKSEKGRIVIVASELYRLAKVDLRNPNPVSSLPAYLYYVSKYANILFCRELAYRLQGTGITANCLHPGMIDSGIWRNVPFPLNLGLKVIIKGFFKTPAEGAQTTLYLAISEEVEGVSGKYYMDCKERQLTQGIQDMGAAKKLWELSEGLVGLTQSDPQIGGES
ncbi:retinol dehydrogenase 14-like [Hetaerina americana]|uniref:retinol dehydrogenase 14-like n=1 Tax=Hetaerina americana TaxID=62018 RepID=UPI003A7F411C